MQTFEIEKLILKRHKSSYVWIPRPMILVMSLSVKKATPLGNHLKKEEGIMLPIPKGVSNSERKHTSKIFPYSPGWCDSMDLSLIHISEPTRQAS